MSLKNIKEKLETISCGPDDSVTQVAVLMQRHKVGAILVKEREKPVGIITDRDLVIRCLTKKTDCSAIHAKEVMTTPVHSMPETASILDLIEHMEEKQVRRMCITDPKEKPLGIVSIGDVFELLSYELGHLAKVSGPRHEKLFRRTQAA